MPYLLAAQMHLDSERGCLAVEKKKKKKTQRFILVSEIGFFFSFFGTLETLIIPKYWFKWHYRSENVTRL